MRKSFHFFTPVYSEKGALSLTLCESKIFLSFRLKEESKNHIKTNQSCMQLQPYTGNS